MYFEEQKQDSCTWSKLSWSIFSEEIRQKLVWGKQGSQLVLIGWTQDNEWVMSSLGFLLKSSAITLVTSFWDACII